MSNLDASIGRRSVSDVGRSSRARSIGIGLVVFGLIGMVVSWLFVLPILVCPNSRGVARQTQCRNNLKQIGLALHNYHDAYGTFPPAYVADENGRPMHSWRVLILPFLDQQPLYERYRFDEPWDGRNNRELAGAIPYVYQCPSDLDGKESVITSYVAVVGPNTAWPGVEGIQLRKDVPDGLSNTICVVEVADSGIHWMEPRDLYVRQMACSINAKAGQGISSAHEGGAMLLFCDGHVQFMGEATTEDNLRRLLERNDGETVEGF